MNTFMRVYEECLREAIRNYPSEYRYSVDIVPTVVARMRVAVLQGSYSKDSRAFRMACKRLWIAHTYKAIAHFVTNHS